MTNLKLRVQVPEDAVVERLRRFEPTEEERRILNEFEELRRANPLRSNDGLIPRWRER